MALGHQRAADALARIMDAEHGGTWIGIVHPEQDRIDAEKEARWQRRLAEMRTAGQDVDENGRPVD